MKKYLLFPFLVFSLFIWTGCDDDEKTYDVSEIEYLLVYPSLPSDSQYIGDIENPVEIIHEEWGDYFHTSFTDESKIFVFNSYSSVDGYAGGFMFNNQPSGPYCAKGFNHRAYITLGTNFYSPVLKFMDSVKPTLPKAYTVDGLSITNSVYAYESMQNGDSYAKKFEKGDWFKVTIYNTDKSKKVEAYLADYRDDKTIMLNNWQWVDLRSLGETTELKFELSSSDNGDWGMNTPAYFCLDGIKLVEKVK